VITKQSIAQEASHLDIAYEFHLIKVSFQQNVAKEKWRTGESIEFWD